MKTVLFLAAALIAGSVSAHAQTNPSNATTLGTETTPGNAAGMPSASTPAGEISTTGNGQPAEPSSRSAFSTVDQRAPIATADSTTTGRTTQ